MCLCRLRNIYRVSQEERTIFWEVIVSVILSKAHSIVLPSRPVAGGKVNILGGHSIGHSKQKTL
jgi:hypothetical protein